MKVSYAVLLVVVVVSGVLWYRPRTKTTMRPPGPVAAPPAPAAPASVAPSEHHATEQQRRRDALLTGPLPEALRRSGATTVESALLVVLNLPESADRSAYFQALLLHCLDLDAATTAQVVSGLADVKLRDHGTTFVLGQWAERDAPAALAWAAEHPRADNDSAWLCAAYEGFAARRPLQALEFLQREELAGETDALARIAVFHCAEQDRLPDVQAAVERLPDGQLRHVLAAALLAAWSHRAPADAAAWLASQASEPAFREGMGTIVRTVATTEPTFAAGLAQRFPDQRPGHDLLADVVHLWARQDVGAAAAWVRGQPPGPGLDRAIARLVEAIAPNDPNEARELIATITDAELRAELLRRHAAR